MLSRLQRTLIPTQPNEEDLQGVLAAVIEACLALSGMSAEGLVRDASWAFHDAGRRVERAQETVRVLRRTLPAASTPGAALVREATLRARESLLSYRRRRAEGGRGRSPLAVALELLVLDETNPRSVAYQLDRLQDDLGGNAGPWIDQGLRCCLTLKPEADVALALDRCCHTRHKNVQTL